MHARRTTLAIVVALALATPLPAPITAEDAGDDPASDVLTPAAVAGMVRVVGSNQSPHSEPAAPPIVVSMKNYGWNLELDTDDSRLSGTWEVNTSFDTYGSGITLRTAIGRLTNEGGSWTTESLGFTPGGGGNHYANYFIGEGGYDGLSAMLLMRPAPGGWEVEGVIAPGPWPEPPEWVLPPFT